MVVAGRIATLAALAAVACGDAAGGSDAGLRDAATEASIDASLELRFGTISGDCEVLDDELVSPESGIFELALSFERQYTDADLNLLSAGAIRILDQDNAGGSSELSEAFAFEVLSRCESATLLKTEKEILYDGEGKITDFLAEIDGEAIGVSVTRAVAYPFDDPYSQSQAEDLLRGKLEDILLSSAHVSEADAWRKQLLAVMAYSPEHGAALVEGFGSLEASLRADTLVLVIVTNGADDFIYCNGLC